LQIIFSEVGQARTGGGPDGIGALGFRHSDQADLLWLAARRGGSVVYLSGQVIDVVVDGLSSDGVQASYANGVAEFAPSGRVVVNSVVNQILR